MARWTSEAKYLKFTWGTAVGVTNGTLELSGATSVFRTLQINESGDTQDVSAGSGREKQYILTMRDTSGNLVTIVEDSAIGTQVQKAFQPGNYGTLEFAPKGTATGAPKYSMVIWATGSDKTFDYSKAHEITASYQKTGEWLFHYDRLGSTY